MDKTFRITPVYDLLLRGSPEMPIGLYHLHLATADQLCRLYYRAGMLTTVKTRLKALADHGYIQADATPIKHHTPAKVYFSSRYYYTLAQKGMRYLEDIGLDIDKSFRASNETGKHSLFIDHALELNDILIAALRLKFTDPRFYLARYVHERTLKRTPYKVSQSSAQVSLIPDAFLDVHQRRPGQTDLSLPLILEHDRGTEQQLHFRRRIQAYRALLQAKGQTQLFGTEAVTVAFTTFVGTRRVMQMRAWAYQELHDTPQLAGMFLFAELPKPLEPRHLLFERRWYTLSNDQPIALLEE